mmetsp:Transcript_1321/g.4439  ORF Transcript_1321/g.4439 Transcript_1321/m.4439 type:complete len:258 (+) Transcript_1321:693-1466(+)
MCCWPPGMFCGRIPAAAYADGGGGPGGTGGFIGAPACCRCWRFCWCSPIVTAAAAAAARASRSFFLRPPRRPRSRSRSRSRGSALICFSSSFVPLAFVSSALKSSPGVSFSDSPASSSFASASVLALDSVDMVLERLKSCTLPDSCAYGDSSLSSSSSSYSVASAFLSRVLGTLDGSVGVSSTCSAPVSLLGLDSPTPSTSAESEPTVSWASVCGGSGTDFSATTFSTLIVSTGSGSSVCLRSSAVTCPGFFVFSCA